MGRRSWVGRPRQDRLPEGGYSEAAKKDLMTCRVVASAGVVGDEDLRADEGGD